METVKYIRVSTVEQKTDRQEKDFGGKIYLDKISGTTPFNDRPQAQKLIKDVTDGKINKVVVHSIDRLGRDTVDVLQTIKWFTEQGISVQAEKEGFETLDGNGKENITAKLVINIMATLSEFENEQRKERQREGIERARLNKRYDNNGGHRPTESLEEFINKDIPQRIIKKFLNRPDEHGRIESVRNIAKLVGCSVGTVQKTKRIAQQLNLWNPNVGNPNHSKLRDYLKE